MECVKAGLEQFAHAVVEHDADEHAEGLFFGHLVRGETIGCLFWSSKNSSHAKEAQQPKRIAPGNSPPPRRTRSTENGAEEDENKLLQKIGIKQKIPLC